MGIESVFPRILFEVAGIPIKDTVLQTWIVCAVLIALAVSVRRKYRVWQPAKWQLTLEFLIEYVQGLIVDTGGRSIPEIVPYLTTMIGFVAISNLLGLLPVFQAPTRDLNTTLALSLVSLGSIQFFGIQRRGLKRHLMSFVEPVFILLPLNLLGLFSRVLSMALRLFGNVVAGEIIGAVIFMLAPVLAPLPLALLGGITSVLQALVFTVLTLVFLVEAMGED